MASSCHLGHVVAFKQILDLVDRLGQLPYPLNNPNQTKETAMARTEDCLRYLQLSAISLASSAIEKSSHCMTDRKSVAEASCSFIIANTITYRSPCLWFA